MQKPDYQNSIVNLMASLSRGLGGNDTGYAPLAGLAVDPDRHVVLLIIDGLGEHLLARFADSFLYRQRSHGLSSVFPSTTASAVTSFSTGVAPQQHAITGWFTWLRELGSVATILPFTPRHGGPPYSAQGVGPEAIIQAAPFADRLPRPCHLLSPAYIVDSDYSRATAGRAARHGYRSLEGFTSQLEAMLHTEEPAYIHAYWSELDSLAHQYGVGSREVAEHFRALDRALENVCRGAAGGRAQFLITADHGLIDTPPGRLIHLDDHPHLAECLALPLCGEPRAAYCYLRPDRRAAFLDYVGNELGHACQAVPSAQLLAEGYFGLGPPAPALEQRIGDYTLLMHGDYVVRDRLANEKPFRQIGVHGGLSPEEMTVPLIGLAP